MANGIYIKLGRKTYRVVPGDCTKHTCSLFKSGVCDDGAYCAHDSLPCLALHEIINVNGGCLPLDSNFKEVKRK